jgi:TatD DNase family protein
MNSFKRQTVIDTHAHIYLDDFDADRADTLTRAKEAGVEALYMPNVDHTSIDRMLEVEERFSGFAFAMMGLHPCYVKKGFEKELYRVESWLARRSFIAIGEIGTDLYWDRTTWPYQQEAFLQQIRWAKQHRLPVAIHCRESIAETLKLIEPFAGPDLTGVFHCFSGTLEQARQCIQFGFRLGIGGVSTFKNGGLDQVIPALALEDLVLETDCPYLAPAPHRGKRNEPAYLAIIAGRVAALKQMPLSDVVAVTSAGARSLFSSPARSPLT